MKEGVRDQPRISFDRVAHRYDETRAIPASQMEAVLEPLVQALVPSDRILEIGVGTGRFGVPLQTRGVLLIGVDISRRMVARGREKGLQDVIFADALALPFRDQTFDSGLSIHVLHLLPDWRAALRELGRVVRESYFTVATQWTNDRSPFRVYRDHLKQAGFERRRPGVFERDLPDRLPPQEEVLIGSFVEDRNSAEHIDRLEQRVYSGLWDAPDALHEEAVEAARRAFPDETFRVEKTIRLLRWDAEVLRGL
ncbi:MAG: class I SAM-dependent methyltransferase [Thermoplasmata archaeon]|nr:class I SAM-dependent methyltransferase [Thermoplasmata archaeon]